MSVFVGVSFPVTAFPSGGTLSTYDDVIVRLEQVVPAGVPVQYLWVEEDGDDHDRLLDDLVDVPVVDVLDDPDSRRLVRVRWQDVETPVPDAVESHGAIVVEATGTGEGWQVLLRFPDATSVAAFYRECRRLGIDVGLERVGKSFPNDEDRDDLSAPQRETLQVAFETGYFEIPRKTTLEALAGESDISEQAVSERLRRGLGSLLDELLREREAGDDDDDDGDSDNDSDSDSENADDATSFTDE